MNAVSRTQTRPQVPVALSRLKLLDAAIAAGSALVLAAGFPKLGAAYAVPLGAGGLFWVWQRASWKRAALLGWFAGLIFFAVGYSWVGHTVSSYIGVFGPFLPIGPALIEAPSFALAGALCALAYARMQPDFAPLGAAAAFTVSEWLRSIGIMGAPFDQLGYTQADTPLRAIAAYAGTYGITFVLCVIGAYLADAVLRRRGRPLAIALGTTVVAVALAWFAWPARNLPAPTIEVAAIQGNIAQSLKWNSLDTAVRRYTLMTRVASARRPQLIVWPETVITTVLNFNTPLITEFESLAAASHATIVAGSQSVRNRRIYNSLYVFAPDATYALYDKRQLVPFAESFPGRRFLGWLPYVGALSGRFSTGTANAVYPTAARLRIAPMICWESAFGDLAFAQMRNGAQLLVISTDDAWFGTTSGPYMHAQIAQLRAIESGAYVVRAAATGISGIIAPDGTWQARSSMEEQVVVPGRVGKPVPVAFARIGPTVVALAISALYLSLFLIPRREAKA